MSVTDVALPSSRRTGCYGTASRQPAPEAWARRGFLINLTRQRDGEGRGRTLYGRLYDDGGSADAASAWRDDVRPLTRTYARADRTRLHSSRLVIAGISSVPLRSTKQ